MADGAQVISREFTKFANLPAITQGAEILNVLQNITTRLERMETQFNGRFDRLEHRMDRLEHRMDRLEHRIDRLEQRMDGLEQRMDRSEQRMAAMDTNNVIRPMNSKINKPIEELYPLHALATNTEIENFPATINTINTMRDPDLSRILRQLELSVQGSVGMKRQRLIQACGVHVWGMERVV
ncbi:hypothetical protein GGR53DRAFT_372362 [Hypoxylon sp. FL1150]|nr:hypothetical protein GGR53DRAFT_372362 [Hypoxylon sp. FL1150]